MNNTALMNLRQEFVGDQLNPEAIRIYIKEGCKPEISTREHIIYVNKKDFSQSKYLDATAKSKDAKQIELKGYQEDDEICLWLS